jgi:6-phospho-3-hexuloisomerase
MMNTLEISRKILRELESAVTSINPSQTEQLIDAILAAKNVYVAGAGRSLLMMRTFAMRLMHFGFKAYIVGDTVTPAITPEDLLIIGSGSGETGTLKIIASNARRIGAKIALISLNPDSSLGHQAGVVVQISASTPKLTQKENETVFQPGANVFEQSLLVVCDSMTIRIIEKLGIQHPNQELMKRHANLE